MRITIKLLPLGKLEWSITDNKGNMIKIAAQAITEWSNVRHLSFELGLTEDLLPTLKILIDGEIIAQGIGSIPLFVSSAFDNYTRFYNKPFDGDIQDFEFGLGEIVVIAAETKHLDKAKRELHFEEKKSNKDLSIRTFSTGSYGITDPGTKNIKMIGNVKKMDAQTFFNLKNNEV